MGVIAFEDYEDTAAEVDMEAEGSPVERGLV